MPSPAQIQTPGEEEVEALCRQIVDALREKKFNDALKLITSKPKVLTFTYRGKVTLLNLFAESSFNPEILNWLCQVMHQHGYSIDKKDADGWSALQKAYTLGHDDAVRVLLPYSDDPYLREWLAQRQLACVIG